LYPSWYLETCCVGEHGQKQRRDAERAFQLLHTALQLPLPNCAIAAAWGQRCLGPVTEVEATITPEFTESLASNLRAWAPTIINAIPNEDESKEVRLELEQTVARLDSHSALRMLGQISHAHVDAMYVA
jgi:hypothetical protein